MSDERPVQSRQQAATLPGVPFDVLACWGLFGAAIAVAMSYPGSSLHAILALPALFFLPGYLTVAAAFPHHEFAPRPTYPNRVTVGERLALSFGVSVALLPLLGLVVAVLAGGFNTTAAGVVLGGYVVLVGALAGVRRLWIPPEDRFRMPVDRWGTALGGRLRRGSALERAMTVALCLSVVLAVGAAGYALAVPNDGETYTDFHLVTETDDGYVAADYPTELTRGEPTEYTVGILNHEGALTDYEVVVTLDRVAEEDGEQRVVESNELARMDATVEHGERWTETHEVTPELTGEDLRLTYHLYIDGAPDSVDRESADRHLQIWVDVGDG